MKIRDILDLIVLVAKKNGLSEPFIVGGIPRDKLLNRLDKLNDLDVSTGDEGSKFLGKEVSLELKAPYKLLEDGHSQIMIGNFQVDFSSNFKIPGVKEMLIKAGMKSPTDFQMEQFSRDFTCNSLLLSTDLKTIKDPIKLGTRDIKNKLIRTCLPARLTLGYDNKRVARAIYLAVSLGFNIDEEIVNWVKNNPKSLTNVKDQYLIKKLLKAFTIDEKRTGEVLEQLNLWPEVPSVPALSKFIIRANKI